MHISLEDKIKWAMERCWSKNMTLYRSSMPEDFEALWLEDVMDTAGSSFNDSDIEMAFQRTIMVYIDEY